MSIGSAITLAVRGFRAGLGLRGGGGGDPATKRKGMLYYSGYDATKPNKKRVPGSGIVRDEDKELPQAPRRVAVSGIRDLHRNYTLAAWMIRKHLDYVSNFRFKSKLEIDKLDARIEELLEWAGRKENFESTGRHTRARAVRMSEARRVVDGDMMWLKLSDGRMQAIEGDRIRTPYQGLPGNIDASKVNHGIILDDNGRATGYVLCKRSKTTDMGWTGQDMYFDRVLPAAWVYHHACWDLGRFDQVRGISPLLSAYNVMRDTYEVMDYAVTKAKLAQLFGIKFRRNPGEEEGALGNVQTLPPSMTMNGDLTVSSMTIANLCDTTSLAIGMNVTGVGIPSGATIVTIVDSATITISAAATSTIIQQELYFSAAPMERQSYDVNLGKGPWMLDLDRGDDAEIMESKSPSTEFQNFIPLVASIAMKALDIPYSFADEAWTNYSGQKQGWALYVRSAESKKAENKEFLNDWTKWRLNVFIDDGAFDEILKELDIDKPTFRRMLAAAGAFEWRAMGMPWLDQLKEAVGKIAAVEGGIMSPIDAAEETSNKSWKEILQDKAAWIAEHKKLGLPMPTWATTQRAAITDEGPEGGAGSQPEDSPEKAGKVNGKQSGNGKQANGHINALQYAMSLAGREELLGGGESDDK